MYICICKKISDKTIQDSIEYGADSRVSLIASLGVGTCCGSCMEVIDDMLEIHHAQKNADALAPTLFVPNPQ